MSTREDSCKGNDGTGVGSSSSSNRNINCDSRGQLNIEQFRNYLLNYRTTTDDTDLDATLELELDFSFKRLLNEKCQMTNKENNPPPPTEAATSSVDGSYGNVPEKPLRRDLLKERLLERIHNDSLNTSTSIYHTMDSSSYICQNTISNDEEYAAINRLMADFNIDQDTSVQQKRSPLKMIGLTCPSTIDEELFSQSELNENSFGKYLMEKKGEFMWAADSSKSSMHSIATSSTTGTSAITVEHYVDVLSEIAARDIAANTFDEKPVNIDDTLEEIEYVLDKGLNYVPKKSKALPQQNACAVDNEDDDVIIIDSSPEHSFTTTKNTGHFKSSAESTDCSFYTAKGEITFKSKTLNSSISIKDERCKNIDTQSDAKANSVVDNNNVEQRGNETVYHDSTNSVFGSAHKQTPNKRKSEYSNGDSDYCSEHIGDMPDFNNTLERVNYMMEQGQKILNKKAGTKYYSPTVNSPKFVHVQTLTNKQHSPAVSGNIRTRTPNSAQVRTPNSAQTRTPNSAQKKILPITSVAAKKPIAKHPTPIKNDVFKRPEQRIRSPLPSTPTVHKALDAHHTRIPKPKCAIAGSQLPTAPSSSSKPQFRHIASPIAAYINNTPEVPFIRTVKPMKNFYESAYYNKMASDHDVSTQSVESFSTKSSLPRKVCNAAPHRQIIDNRHIVTPGGKSVQKLIGNAPLVIRHDGRIKSNQTTQAAHAQPLEESLSDLSILSGDISVQVVQDVHRNH